MTQPKPEHMTARRLDSVFELRQRNTDLEERLCELENHKFGVHFLQNLQSAPNDAKGIADVVTDNLREFSGADYVILDIQGKEAGDSGEQKVGSIQQDIQLVEGQTIYGTLKIGINPGNRFDAEKIDYITDKLLAPIAAKLRNYIEHHKLVELATIDEKTKLSNYRHLDQILTEFHMHQSPYALVAIDIDNFKDVNKIYGHDGADEILGKFAELLRLCFRTEDIKARFGGDEFVIVIPRSNENGVADRVKTLQECMSYFTFRLSSGIDAKITTSIGIADYDNQRDGCSTWDAVFKKADNALFYSKGKGKDRYTVSAEVPSDFKRTDSGCLNLFKQV